MIGACHVSTNSKQFNVVAKAVYVMEKRLIGKEDMSFIKSVKVS